MNSRFLAAMKRPALLAFLGTWVAGAQAKVVLRKQGFDMKDLP